MRIAREIYQQLLDCPEGLDQERLDYLDSWRREILAEAAERMIAAGKGFYSDDFIRRAVMGEQ